MLVSTIIANGQLKVDNSNTSFYTAAEGLADVQASWEDVYAILCQGNDDYFLTELYIVSSSFGTIANRQFMYTYALPSDFYRLRYLQYQGQGGSNTFYPVTKMSTENLGNTQGTPAYRMVGQNLQIYDPSNYQMYYMGYYPKPAVLTSGTDLSYPNNMIPEIMVYQVASEVAIKMKRPTNPYKERRDELLESMRKQYSRDDFKAEPIKNTFATGFAPYV
jgi:hypothetical protein